jgi:Beta-ketoacyl synthase, N-terminal domain
MATVGVQVERWRFWSPESADPGAWLNHWRSGDAHGRAGDPDTSAIPAAQRRRASRLSRMALAVALDVSADKTVDYSVFCSQHGEIARTREILSSISAGTEISPTAFAQSVHNTSSGLFTIITKSNAPSTSLASGAGTFAYGWMEAQAFLAANPSARVLLVDFDEALPEEYRRYSEQTQCDHAFALLLSAAQQGGIEMRRADAGADDALPLGPRVAAWLQRGEARLSVTSGGEGWQWQQC